MTQRKTTFRPVHLTIPARTALQRLTLMRSLDVPDRVTLSAMVLAVIDVANAHPDELTVALAARMQEGTELPDQGGSTP